MKSKSREYEYLTPEVIVVEIDVERGFQASLEDPYEKETLEW